MKEFVGFVDADFAAFAVPTLEGRMAAIKAGPRPKLEALGAALAPALASLTGHPVYPIVAKHLRRKVNPPVDTWVAWSANPRGYKMLPHFQVGLWETHVFIQAGVIYEAAARPAFAANLLNRMEAIKAALPAHYRWLEDYTQPHGIPHGEMTAADFSRIAERLRNRREADCMAGVTVDRDAAVARGPAFAGDVLAALQRLMPVYRLADA
ncbi:MAG TPA: DUF1054 family protein [Symbiobacteriaceae bacterium]|jgi:uncharacterized protein YktB (UPF0637 family)